MSEDRVARAREIIADLKAAGGWDLSGWEYYFADEAENYVAPLPKIPALRQGEGAFKVDGEWLPVNILSVSVRDHQDLADLVSASGFVHRHVVRPRERTIEMTCRLDATTMDLARLQDFGAIEVAIGVANAEVLTQKVVVTQHEIEFPLHGNPSTVEFTMRAVQ